MDPAHPPQQTQQWPFPPWNPFQQMQMPPQAPPASTSQSPAQSPAAAAFPAAFMSSMYQWFMQSQGQSAQQPNSSFTPQMQSVSPPQDNQVQPQSFDDNLLAQSIVEKTSRGMSYKAAIETLHLQRGRQAYEWKDHYLEHKPRIDKLVTQLKDKPRSSNGNGHPRPSDQRPKAVHRKANAARRSRSETPSDSDESVIHTRTDVVSTSKPLPVNGTKPTKRRRSPSSSPQRASVSSSRRKTMNSMSSFPAHSLLALIPPSVPIDPETNLPAVPSRPPTPPEPESIKPGGKGNLFTERDAQFFLKFLAWKLVDNPDCSKAEIAEALGQAAPHHPASSWGTYWGRHQQVADRMWLLSQLSEKDKKVALDRWNSNKEYGNLDPVANDSSPRKKAEAKHRESSLSMDEDGALSDSNTNAFGPDAGYDTDPIDESEPGEFEAALGDAGDAFEIAELRVLAKYIAQTENWYNKSGRERFEEFHARHNQRSLASWKEYYRRRHKEVDRFVRKYKKRDEAKQAIKKQRGRPSWAVRQVQTSSIPRSDGDEHPPPS